MPAPPAIPPQGRTRAILQPGDKSVLTLNQETDVRTAVTRGLREYVEQLEWRASGGRLLRFSQVFETWAEAESAASYPSAVILVAGPGEYDPARLTPQAQQRVEGMALFQTAEFKADAQVGVWATDPKERMALVAMLEAALSPADFMYGLLLELPHYFNARALCEPTTGPAYEDSAEDARRRYRRAQITVRCSVPMLRTGVLPDMAPRFDLRKDSFATTADITTG